MLQAPLEHEGVPLVPLHTLPQAPQFATSPESDLSHPSLGLLLQFP